MITDESQTTEAAVTIRPVKSFKDWLVCKIKNSFFRSDNSFISNVEQSHKPKNSKESHKYYNRENIRYIVGKIRHFSTNVA